MNELVIIIDSQAITTSLQVAQSFEKEHKDVLRAIDSIEFGGAILRHEMFIESYYENRGKRYRQVLMNRDGFSLLAMGFTGSKAMQFKLQYINAFNKMESTLRQLAPTNMVEALELALEQAKTIEVQSQVIGELKPKADYVDNILKSKSLTTVTQIAKDYGMSAISLNKKLNELGVQFKQSDQWILYRKYHDKGYTKSDTFVIEEDACNGQPLVNITTKWTQKGRLFLYELLKEEGIVPMIEHEAQAIRSKGQPLGQGQGQD